MAVDVSRALLHHQLQCIETLLENPALYLTLDVMFQVEEWREAFVDASRRVSERGSWLTDPLHELGFSIKPELPAPPPFACVDLLIPHIEEAHRLVVACPPTEAVTEVHSLVLGMQHSLFGYPSTRDALSNDLLRLNEYSFRLLDDIVTEFMVPLKKLRFRLAAEVERGNRIEPRPAVPLTPLEESIVKAIRRFGPMVGAKIAARINEDYNGHFKGTLSGLVKRAILKNERRTGYFLPTVESQDQSQD